jgi:hypothetical protein
LTLGHGSGSLKVPVVSFLLSWSVFELSHNQGAALMPIMIGMMVCAVVVVGAAEAHNLDTHLKHFYTRPSRPMSNKTI